MTDTKSTDTRHKLRAGDTPALGMPIVEGTGGKRRSHALGIDVDATAEITVGDDVLWHDREAQVAKVYPPRERWLRTLCKLEFSDGGTPVRVGRDELELITDSDGTRYFQTGPEETAPIPAVDEVADPTDVFEPVDADARDQGVLVAALLEEHPRAVAQLAVAALAAEGLDEDPDAGARLLFAEISPRPGLRTWLRRSWLGLVWSLVVSLLGALVDAITAGFEEIGDNVFAHAAFLAKALLVLLAVTVFAGVGIAWWLR